MDDCRYQVTSGETMRMMDTLTDAVSAVELMGAISTVKDAKHARAVVERDGYWEDDCKGFVTIQRIEQN